MQRRLPICSAFQRNSNAAHKREVHFGEINGLENSMLTYVVPGALSNSVLHNICCFVLVCSSTLAYVTPCALRNSMLAYVVPC